ncbi:MAG: class II fructose-bisphosphatase [Patescibacteria group bacterium]|nr:class II fructose-bisphosphatase [Patescibacteria group bacterium]
MDRNLALEFVRVTEAAAIEAAKWVGRGEKKKADGAAVEAMRKRFNQVDFKGKVVIGEGEKDEAPMLYNGEIVGTGLGAEMDLAIDPLECTDSVAWGRYNAISVIASGKKGSLLCAPDTYMEKLAVGKEASNVIDLEAPIKDNLKKIAKALGKNIKELTVMVLDRDRHQEIIKQIREVGSRVRLITDGDVSACIATCFPDSGVDVYMGIGGSTEAVLSAVAMKVMGGEILCRFKPKKEEDVPKIKAYGIKKLDKIFSADDLAKGKELSFTATGVIEGPLLDGVKFEKNRIITHSIVIRGVSGTIRYIKTYHHYYK